MTEPLTEAELEAIEARAKAATGGPWQCDVVLCDGEVYAGNRLIARIGFQGNESEPNAAFIAAAREDVPRLIAEVRRLNQDLVQCQELHTKSYELLQSAREERDELRAVAEAATRLQMEARKRPFEDEAGYAVSHSDVDRLRHALRAAGLLPEGT